jgi:HAMP domain-containing protein
MKLTIKFNIIFLVIFGIGLLATGLIAQRFLQQNARNQVLQDARLLMDTSSSTRTYTAQQIRPILEKWQRESDVFYPQSVPAFSAIKIFSYLHQQYPEYSYKEPTLNPTNPEDRAVEWETDVINIFRNDTARKDYIGERDTPTGRSLYIAKPLSAAGSCLTCHSTPEAAPAAMVRIYGRNNGFGWKQDEIIGAQIVSVPMSVPTKVANTALWNLMLWLALTSLVSMVLLNFALVAAVVRPVRRLSAAADEISKGNLDVPEMPVTGKDEVSTLAGSFNRMHRSLVKAIKMLEE